ncbi:MAG: methyltransferase domain-containing protein [Bacteroidales bacterium]|nr:methyltransferase domain-containing protein [Bacteroidales bacterium]
MIKSLVKSLLPGKYHQQIKWFVFRNLYRGSNYQCPLCKSNLKKLLPFGSDLPVFSKYKIVGGGYRPNALCPVCNSSDRERLLYLFLKHKTNLFNENLKLLHIAPENNLERILKLQSNLEYVTGDLLSEFVMHKIDICDIQFEDNFFDAIICNHVFEHVPDDQKAMEELFRVLKPGGWAILQVPISQALEKTYEDFSITSPEEREKAFGKSDHVRIYGKDYVDRLKMAGFRVEKYKWISEKELFGNGKNIFALNKGEDVFLVRKQ